MPTATPPRLTAGRTLATIAIGAGVWAAGVVLVRWLLAQGVLHDALTGPVFVAVFAGTAPLVWAVPRLLGLPARYRLDCTAIIVAIAALLDAGAIRWTAIYSADPAARADAGAALLWGLGVAMLLALIMANGPDPESVTP